MQALLDVTLVYAAPATAVGPAACACRSSTCSCASTPCLQQIWQRCLFCRLHTAAELAALHAQVIDVWEPVTESDVQTPMEVYQELLEDGYNVVGGP
jgi:hypothetical protein